MSYTITKNDFSIDVMRDSDGILMDLCVQMFLMNQIHYIMMQ